MTAPRIGDVTVAEPALKWLSERTRVTPTEWALEIELVVRALLSEGDGADDATESPWHDAPAAGVEAQLDLVHLIYVEWVPRERHAMPPLASQARIVTRRHVPRD